jgi:hypothetical protein
MTKKIANKKVVAKNDTPKTLNILPVKGLLGLLADAAMVFTLIIASFSLLLLCVSMAEKITITIGK